MSLPFPATASSSSFSRISSLVPTGIRAYTSDLRDRFEHTIRRTGIYNRAAELLKPAIRSVGHGYHDTSGKHSLPRRLLACLLTVPNILILLWITTLWWGERKVWRDSIRNCSWDKWEAWPSGAAPHHVVLVADPQLIDAHTYPGRGWPLSALTEFYVDTNLYRSYTSLQSTLRPDTTFFLGDLFDGGREWATADGKYQSPEERFQSYDDEYWQAEYRRFVDLFFDTWKGFGSDEELDNEEDAPLLSSEERRRRKRRQQRRQIIASLPGNHDIGFSNGVNPLVRERFETWFGPANRVDVIGNHTIVSLDAPSLSAMDPGEREEAEHESETETPGMNKNEEGGEIWKEADEFLSHVQESKEKAVRAELRGLRGETYTIPDNIPTNGDGAPEFPTIILSHIPFWRDRATPCGPLREHYPDPKTSPDDERNSIKIQRGYQYQNVLTDWVSNHIMEKVGNRVQNIYSGDDHDYCEVVHERFATANGAGPIERTVKSISMAMGVRKPGFLLVSLWNPVDTKTGESIGSQGKTPMPTVQDHLCLLPDQLSIFICYGYMLVLTFVALVVRAIVSKHYGSGYTLIPQLSRQRSNNRSVSANHANSLEDVLEDQPLLPLAHRHTAPVQHSSPNTSSLSLTIPHEPSSQGQIKDVSSPMVDNDASFAGQWSASSSANPGHGKRQSSIGGRGRARSLSLNTKGKNSAASSPALSAITGGSWDPEGIEKLDINNGSRHGRIVSNPVPIGRSNSPSPGRISPPGMERENNTAMRNADTTASRSYAINIGMVDSGFSLTENNEHDPFGPSSQSSVRWGEGMKNPKVQQSFDAVNKHFLSPVKPIAIIGLGFYLFLLWTW